MGEELGGVTYIDISQTSQFHHGPSECSKRVLNVDRETYSAKQEELPRENLLGVFALEGLEKAAKPSHR